MQTQFGGLFTTILKQIQNMNQNPGQGQNQENAYTM